jgi:aspartate kinase
MIVAKFGGTSVGDAPAIERAAAIIAERAPRQPLVVVSALGGATNALIALGEQAASGQLILAIRGVEALRERHLTVAGELLGDGPDAVEVIGELSATFDELAALAEALSVLGHATTRSIDAIASKGELLSSMLIVAAFRKHGIPAEFVDPGSVMITGEEFGKAEPRADRIAERASVVIRPLLAAGRVPIVGGFVGATEHGITTTLGRGGSDYSASLFGAALGAEAIEIWTDVDGMLTADPRVVPEALVIERIRFDEASELASFGAKVLHPSTIAPAVRLGIPVSILNSRRPQGRGTLIAFDAPRRPVTAIAGKEGVTVVKVSRRPTSSGRTNAPRRRTRCSCGRWRTPALRRSPAT